MLRVIKENRNKNCMDNVNSCSDEIDRLMVAIVRQDLQDIKERTVNIVQNVVDIWDKANLSYQDVEDSFRDFYVKKMEKGYTLSYLKGESYNEKMISDLQEELIRKDMKIENLKTTLEVVLKIADAKNEDRQEN